MSTWLLIALGSNAGLVLLLGAFLAGTLRRRDITLGLLLAGLGSATIAILLMSSVDDWPSAFQFNPIRVAKRVWETSDYRVVLTGALTGIPVPLIGFVWIMYGLRRTDRWRAISASGFLGLCLIGLLGATLSASPSVKVPKVDIAAQLTVPAGFEIQAYLPEGNYRPTSIAFDSRGRLFVANRDGVVNIVDDTDGDGVGDKVKLFVAKDGLALGLAISDDDKTVYVAGGGEVLMVRDTDLDGVPDDKTVIIKGLPTFTYDAHSNNGLAIGPDGRLYLTLGSTSDHGPEEHPLAGSILVSNLDGSDLQVYASGLRNSYDLTFNSSGQLFATDNGPDFQDQTLNWSPPDELNLVEAGEFYGYPDFFGYPPGWSNTSGPIVVFPSHSVPTGTLAYQGMQFPSEFQDKVFVTLFGPFVNPQFASAVEAKVVVVTIEEASPDITKGFVEDFASGFVAPIDVAVDSEGRLYVADYGGHQVYQISWLGDGG